MTFSSEDALPEEMYSEENSRHSPWKSFRAGLKRLFGHPEDVPTHQNEGVREQSKKLDSLPTLTYASPKAEVLFVPTEMSAAETEEWEYRQSLRAGKPLEYEAMVSARDPLQTVEFLKLENQCGGVELLVHGISDDQRLNEVASELVRMRSYQEVLPTEGYNGIADPKMKSVQETILASFRESLAENPNVAKTTKEILVALVRQSAIQKAEVRDDKLFVSSTKFVSGEHKYDPENPEAPILWGEFHFP